MTYLTLPGRKDTAMAKMYDEKKSAIRVTARYEDFEGDIAKWKDSFYTVWRYQLTWSFAYRIDLRESRKGVFIDLLVKPAYRKNVIEMLEDLGYRNVAENTEFIGEVWALEHKGLEDISELVLDY